MVYYGEGGWNHTDIYTMPVHLRLFYFRTLMDRKKKESDEMKKAQSKAKRR